MPADEGGLPDGMTDTERLVAFQAICRLKARRDHAVDARDWDLYAELHTDDYVAASVGVAPLIGGRAVADVLAARSIGVTCAHHSHTPVIDFQDAAHATGIWAMEDNLFWKQDGEPQWLRGFGFYHECYEKHGGRWLFSYRRLDRTHILTSPGVAHLRLDRSGESRR